MILKNLVEQFSIAICFLLAVQNSCGNTDKYRLIFAGNPSSEVTVGWNQIDGGTARVYYGLSDLGEDTSSYKGVNQTDKSNSHMGMVNSFTLLKNLKDGETYYFVIADENSVSPRFKFRTIPKDPEFLSIIHGGDSRSNRTGRIYVNKMAKKFRPHCVAFGGDFIDVSDSQSWQYWLDDWQHTIGDDGLILPLIPTRGNHETDEDVHKIFDTPTADNVYPINFGKKFLKLWVLNSEIGNYAEQAQMLKTDLNNNGNFLWKMAHWHSPISPIGPKSFMNGMYDNWAKLLYDYGFHIAGESHSHVVKRTFPVKPFAGSPGKFIRDDAWGTIYIGEGCWGVPLRSVLNHYDWVQGSGSFHEFNWIQFSTHKIDLMTIMVPENSDSIPYVHYDSPFVPPKGTEIWRPQAGDPITQIFPRIKPIKGCTDKNSKNFNPNANLEDGSCFYEKKDSKYWGNSEFWSNLLEGGSSQYLELHLKEKTSFNLKIYDKKGQILYTKKINPESYKLEVPIFTNSKLQYGIYYVSIDQKNHFTAQSVVFLPH